MTDTFIVLFRFPAGSFRLPSPGVMLSHLRNTEELPQSASPRGPDLSCPLCLLTLRLEKLQAALTPSLVSNSLKTCHSHLLLWWTEPHPICFLPLRSSSTLPVHLEPLSSFPLPSSAVLWVCSSKRHFLPLRTLEKRERSVASLRSVTISCIWVWHKLAIAKQQIIANSFVLMACEVGGRDIRRIGRRVIILISAFWAVINLGVVL